MHHAVLYVREPGDPWLRDFRTGVVFAPPGGREGRLRAGQTTSDILALYTPGAGPYTCPPGMARKIPAGSDLVLQIHYTSKETDARDQIRIGISFAPAKPDKRVMTLQMDQSRIDIPPGERDVRYSVSGTLPNDALLLSLFPHMHLRGSAFEFEIAGEHGGLEPLLYVKPYDFYWQLRYEFKAPRALKAGTRLRWTGHFDNSPGNPRNPDPSAEVHWGEQSTDEMMIGFFDVAVDPSFDKPRLFNRDTVRGMFQSGVIAVAFLSLLLAGAVNLSGAPETVLRAIPGKLAWRNPPAAWDIRDGETLTIKAARMTDWFIDPFDGRTIANSPMLLFPAAKDFVLSAKVTVDFRSKWDAGALVLLAGDTLWAKFAFELSADGHPTLVSVVTRGISDDCNSFSITEHSVYLQMARSGQAIVLYASTDGSSWKILRSFSLGPTAEVRIGFSSQSPAGEGLTSAFSDIKYSEKRIANIYTGN